MKKDIDKKVSAFFSEFTQKTFKKGQTILSPDSEPTVAYYVKKGFVKTFTVSPQGVETTIHLFANNSYFPLMWIISGIPNRFHYEALNSVELYLAPKDKLVEFIKNNPDVLLNLTYRLLKGMDRLTLRIEQLSTANASERLSSMLIFLARHFGEKKDNKIYLEEMFTHKDLASLAGLSRETTSREWKKLQQKKLVILQERRIVINDPAQLNFD